MPKLRKYNVQQADQQSQKIGKYLTFEQQETAYPEPIQSGKSQEKQESPLGKKRGKSRKLTNQSQKKPTLNIEEKTAEIQKTSKRKSRSKKQVAQKILLNREIAQKQNEETSNSKPVKVQQKAQKKQRSKRKTNIRSLRKNKNQDEQLEDNLPQGGNTSSKVKQSKAGTETRQQCDQDSNSHLIDFNKRCKTKKQNDQQIMDIISSKYTEDQISVNFGKKYLDDDSDQQFGRRMESDTTQLELIVKKKEKKGKAQKEVKIKNKYFSDISFETTTIGQNQNACQYEGQEPPENSEQLVFERKEPRQNAQNLNQMIQKRVNNIKDRRQFKGVDGDFKLKNHLKMKLQQVKDHQQIEIDIAIPNLFTKKSASAAMYIKNTMQRQQRIGKNSQLSQINQSKLHKTSSVQSMSSDKNKSQFPTKKETSQQFQLKNKKKGIKRQDFYNNLNKQIKNKRCTEINSQQIKDCFKTSTLDEANFDIDLEQDSRSHGSNQGLGRNNHRRQSVDSQGSRKSQVSIKSNNQKGQKPPIQSSSHKALKGQSKWNIDFNERIQQNSNSVSFKTNTYARTRTILENPPISQVKQSDGASSIQNSSNYNSLSKNQNLVSNSLRFDNKAIKQQVDKSLKESFQILESDVQKDNQKSVQNQDKSFNKWKDAKKQESAQKIAQKMKKSAKDARQNKVNKIKSQKVEDLLNDSDQISTNKQKRPKKSRKSKKNKQNNQNQDQYESYFQEQAGYSSSQQGHTQQDQADLNEDIDIDGNLNDLIDTSQVSQRNQNLVLKKFLQDQQKKDDQIIERIMKGVYGRKKYEETQSERKMKERMKQAAKRNKLQDDQDSKDIEIDKPASIVSGFDQETTKKNCQELEIDERQRKKLRQLEEQFNHGGIRGNQYNESSMTTVHKGQTWKMVTAALPSRRSHYIAPLPQSGIKNKAITRQKSVDNKKHLLDLKSTNVQQQIHNKRFSVDRNRIDDVGNNRNKVQKTTQIQLDIRDKNINLSQDIQI